jgi:hypothetical protein
MIALIFGRIYLEVLLLIHLFLTFLQPHAFNFVPFIQPVYNAIFKRLTAQDQDQVCDFSE